MATSDNLRLLRGRSHSNHPVRPTRPACRLVDRSCASCLVRPPAPRQAVRRHPEAPPPWARPRRDRSFRHKTCQSGTTAARGDQGQPLLSHGRTLDSRARAHPGGSTAPTRVVKLPHCRQEAIRKPNAGLPATVPRRREERPARTTLVAWMRRARRSEAERDAPAGLRALRSVAHDALVYYMKLVSYMTATAVGCDTSQAWI